MQEHLKNLAALRQRCQDVGNPLDRKKNANDPLSNPVRLFRKNKEEAQKVSLGDYRTRIDKNLRQLRKKNDELAEQWVHEAHLSVSKQRPLSAVVKDL